MSENKCYPRFETNCKYYDSKGNCQISIKGGISQSCIEFCFATNTFGICPFYVDKERRLNETNAR